MDLNLDLTPARIHILACGNVARREFLLGGPSPDRRRAEAALRQAIEAARWQEAKSSELWATTSLARLLDKQGKRDEARDARRNLQLVHRGLRHGRSERRQSPP